MGGNLGIFFFLVFTAVFLLTIGLTVPVFGENRGAARMVKRRIQRLQEDAPATEAVHSLRRSRERRPDALEEMLKGTRAGEWLGILIEQSGSRLSMGRVFLFIVGLAAGAAWMVSIWVPISFAPFVAAPLAGVLPIAVLQHKRKVRLERFEEQLPDAIDVIRRALQAGYPLSESLRLVGEELEDPIRSQFAMTFADINYGSDLKWALVGLMNRVPSVNVMAMVTAILIQRETGGNLAEILGKLSSVIRGRFRFHRKVRTLSAEGRLSTWVLALTPFVLALIIHLTTPEYLAPLVQTETGLNLIAIGLTGICLGILWLRRIIRIEV